MAVGANVGCSRGMDKNGRGGVGHGIDKVCVWVGGAQGVVHMCKGHVCLCLLCLLYLCICDLA